MDELPFVRGLGYIHSALVAKGIATEWVRDRQAGDYASPVDRAVVWALGQLAKSR